MLSMKSMTREVCLFAILNNRTAFSL